MEILFKALVLLGILSISSMLKAINYQLGLIIMKLDREEEIDARK